MSDEVKIQRLTLILFMLLVSPTLADVTGVGAKKN